MFASSCCTAGQLFDAKSSVTLAACSAQSPRPGAVCRHATGSVRQLQHAQVRLDLNLDVAGQAADPL